MGLALALFNHPFVHRLLQGTTDAHRVHQVHQAYSANQLTAPRAPKRPTPRALRVVRVVDDSCRSRSTAARVLISGSMGQVCAELDRLAALEAAA